MLHIIRAARRPLFAAALATCLVVQSPAAMTTLAYADENPIQHFALASAGTAAQMVNDAAKESAKEVKRVQVRKEKAAKAAAKKAAQKKARLASGDFCLAQSWHGRCTITSVAMMLRRASYLDGSKSWKNVTESSVAADGWIGGVGVKFSFKSAGYKVVKRSLKTSGSSAGRTAELKALLKKHPEGIAIYDPGVPHAVLLSGYDKKTGKFTCADPAQGYAGKQVGIGKTWNASVRGSGEAALAGFSEYWVIA